MFPEWLTSQQECFGFEQNKDRLGFFHVEFACPPRSASPQSGPASICSSLMQARWTGYSKLPIGLCLFMFGSAGCSSPPTIMQRIEGIENEWIITLLQRSHAIFNILFHLVSFLNSSLTCIHYGHFKRCYQHGFPHWSLPPNTALFILLSIYQTDMQLLPHFGWKFYLCCHLIWAACPIHNWASLVIFSLQFLSVHLANLKVWLRRINDTLCWWV